MMYLSAIRACLDATLVGSDCEFTGVSTDTRTLKKGDLFIALKGENFDGNLYVTQAAQLGAAAAIVQRGDYAFPDLPRLEVPDGRIALGQLSALWRQRFTAPIAAVTGSNGKTTVKEMLAAILQLDAPGAVLATAGNFNNDIGLPLTLLQLREQHRYAVVEMGMNHPGEISYLTKIARPQVALINNAAAAHLQGLGSVEAVARAKGEIFEGLGEDGIAVCNFDDPYSPLWMDMAQGHPLITFGLNEGADIGASHVAGDYFSEVEIIFPQDRVETKIAVPGRHNVMNALAAAAAAYALGINVQTIGRGLAGFSGVKGRMQRKKGLKGCMVIDDSYNANPASVRSAIDWLATMPGKTILVLGDMGELGADAIELHRLMGKAARQAGVKKLYATGPLAQAAAEAFGEGAAHFAQADEIVGALQQELTADTTVLVKGSRFMKMEKVVAGIVEEKKECC